MKESYLKFYTKYKLIANFIFLKDSFFSKNRLKKLSLINRQLDYIDLSKNNKLFILHYHLNKKLLEGLKNWESYDYGEGYFYQSCNKINIRGFRNTENRIEAMDLPNILKNKKVLEIGCNSGFLTISISNYCQCITAFDPAAHLVEIGQITSNYLNIKNINFHICTFENFESTEKFDVILSFANHSTYDGNTEYSIKSYLEKISYFLEPGGLLLFESHSPLYEGKGLVEVCKLISERFVIKSQKIIKTGSFLDRERTFLVCGLND